MKLYVNGTKKAANEMIVKGQSIYGVNYSIFLIMLVYYLFKFNKIVTKIIVKGSF